MVAESDKQDNFETASRVEPADASTRRELIGDLARKALYVTPIVMILTASQARAHLSFSCTRSGIACLTDEECCSGNCVADGMMCAMGF